MYIVEFYNEYDTTGCPTISVNFETPFFRKYVD